MLCVAQVAMSLLRSQMRNQLINYCFGAASLRHFRNGKVNQGRQSLTLHLARDVADRLERRFEPIPPATLSVSLSRLAVGRKDQGPVSADPFFVSQLIRVEAQRSFGVLIARLHRPAQLAPPEQIAQLPLQIVTDIESRLIGPILLFVRGDQSDTSQLINLLCRSRRPILLHRLALTIAKADRLESFIRQLRVPILDRDPFATDVNAVIRFDRAHINHVLARDVLADLSAGVPTIHHHRVAVALLDRPINQLTGQGQFAREGDLPVGVITADTLENLAQIFALLTLLLLASQHFRAIFDAVLGDPLERLLDIHLIVPTQFQWIIDSPVGVVNRHHVVREAITFGARDEPLSEQWKVLAVLLIVSIIHDQDRVLLGSRRRVFTQQFQATFVNRGSRPRVLGEKTIEAALVLDLNHERPIDRLNGFVLGNEQTCQVALKVFKLLRAEQILIALCIFLNSRRYLDQGQHMTSFRFCDQKPIGSHSSSLGTAPQRRELPQKSSYKKRPCQKQRRCNGYSRTRRIDADIGPTIIRRVHERPFSSRLTRKVLAPNMHPPIRRVEEDDARGIETEHLTPTGFRTTIDQLNHLAARRRDDNRLLASHVHQLNAIAALGDDALDVVAGYVFADLHSFAADGLDALSFQEALARGAVHAVPQCPDDVRPFGVSVLESYQYLVADLRHKHNTPPTPGARGSHPRPGGPGVIHPVIPDLNSPHPSRVVMRDDAAGDDAGHKLRLRLLHVGVIHPRRGGEFVAVAVGLVVAVDDADQAVIALRVEIVAFDPNLVACFETHIAADACGDDL